MLKDTTICNYNWLVDIVPSWQCQVKPSVDNNNNNNNYHRHHQQQQQHPHHYHHHPKFKVSKFHVTHFETPSTVISSRSGLKIAETFVMIQLIVIDLTFIDIKEKISKYVLCWSYQMSRFILVFCLSCLLIQFLFLPDAMHRRWLASHDEVPKYQVQVGSEKKF